MSYHNSESLLAIATFGLLTILGCSDSEEIKPPPPEAYEISAEKFGDYTWSAGELKLAQSYQHYESLSAGIKEADTIEVFEGLPHDLWERELFDAELKNKDTVEIAGYPFYAKPVVLSESDRERLTELYCTKETFVPYSGVKMCGGYHPDWLVRWKQGEKEWIVHFCFGCCEATTIHEDTSMLCNIWTTKPIENLLNPYHRQRPEMKY